MKLDHRCTALDWKFPLYSLIGVASCFGLQGAQAMQQILQQIDEESALRLAPSFDEDLLQKCERLSFASICFSDGCSCRTYLTSFLFWGLVRKTGNVIVC